MEYTIAYLVKNGAKLEKTVLGVPLYGRAFALVDPSENSMGDPVKDTAFQVSWRLDKKEGCSFPSL